MHPYKAGPLLENIHIPQDLRDQVSIDDLPQVSDELRQYIVDVISEIGNSHFGASLGVVELTVTLHYVFNTPYDQLVWDVGHQAYGHKILTGRRELFHTNRTKGGISGFPKRSERIPHRYHHLAYLQQGKRRSVEIARKSEQIRSGCSNNRFQDFQRTQGFIAETK